MRRGFTLVELMTVIGLLLLLTALFIHMLVPTFEAVARSSAHREVQQAGLVALGWVARDLQSTAGTGLRLEGRGLAAHPLKDVDADGNQRWEDRLVLYLHKDRLLLRRLYRALTLKTSAPHALPLAELRAVLDGPRLVEDRVVARGVTEFSVTPADDGFDTGFAQPVLVEIALEKPVERPGQPVQQLRLQRKVYLLNKAN